jgi:hypothetical protein
VQGGIIRALQGTTLAELVEFSARAPAVTVSVPAEASLTQVT